MLAISFARRDKAQASAILSDALVIALGLGVALAVAMYFYAPPALQSIAGQASAAVVEPAVTYVRIRYAIYLHQYQAWSVIGDADDHHFIAAAV
jgi:Na+-driven multidrug efflux pump